MAARPELSIPAAEDKNPDCTPQSAEPLEPSNPQVILETKMDSADGQLFQLTEESLQTLRYIAGQLEKGRFYKEKEINALLKVYYEDYITLRRYLIEHDLLARRPDGSQYWVKE